MEIVTSFPSIARVTGRDLRILNEPVTLHSYVHLLEILERDRDIWVWWGALRTDAVYISETSTELGILPEIRGRFWSFAAWTKYIDLVKEGKPVDNELFDTLEIYEDGSYNYQGQPPGLRLRGLINRKNFIP